MIINKIYLVFAAHYLGDFVIQTSWMAQNKSKSIKALSLHIATYTMFLVPFGLKFACFNGIAHFCIDFVTSRISSKAYSDQKIKLFWGVIGFDQMLHAFCLIWSMNHFLKGL